MWIRSTKTMRVVLAVMLAEPLFFAGTGECAAQELELVSRGAPDSVVGGVALVDGEVTAFYTARGGPDGEARPAAAQGYREGQNPGERVVTSPDGSRTGRVSYGEGEAGRVLTRFVAEGPEGGAVELSVEGPARFLLSDDGSTIAAVAQDIHAPGDGRVVLFDGGGERLGELEQPRLRQAALAADGSRLVVNTGSDGVLVLDRRGEVLHRLPRASDVKVSPDGAWVALLGGNATTLYQAGEEAARISTEVTARDAAFDAAGEHVAVADRGSLRLVETATGRVLFERPAPRGWEYRSVDVGPAGVLAGLLKLERRRSRKGSGRALAEVVLLDRNGDVSWRTELTPDAWNRSTPEVHFFEGGAQAAVVTRNAVYRFTPPGQR